MATSSPQSTSPSNTAAVSGQLTPVLETHQNSQIDINSAVTSNAISTGGGPVTSIAESTNTVTSVNTNVSPQINLQALQAANLPAFIIQPDQAFHFGSLGSPQQQQEIVNHPAPNPNLVQYSPAVELNHVPQGAPGYPILWSEQQVLAHDGGGNPNDMHAFQMLNQTLSLDWHLF